MDADEAHHADEEASIPYDVFIMQRMIHEIAARLYNAISRQPTPFDRIAMRTNIGASVNFGMALSAKINQVFHRVDSPQFFLEYSRL
jgi:hypothetical protein